MGIQYFEDKDKPIQIIIGKRLVYHSCIMCSRTMVSYTDRYSMARIICQFCARKVWKKTDRRKRI